MVAFGPGSQYTHPEDVPWEPLPGVKDPSPKQEDPTEHVNHPSHYGGEDNLYEAIKVIEAWGLGFCLGNTVKYVSRAGKKGDRLQDLKKARWYLDREISNLENS